MAIVVESQASSSGTSTSSVTITKPTGLAVGDCLIATIINADADDETITLPSGWTSIVNQTGSNADATVRIMAKIAEAADVSASDFTFSASNTCVLLGGSILRVTGIALDLNAATDSDTLGSGGSPATFTTTLTPNTDGALWLLGISITNGSAFSTGLDTYFATGSSVTFTESFDFGFDTGTFRPRIGMAYGIQTTSSAATAYGASWGGINYGKKAAALVAFSESINASSTNTLVTTTSTTFSQAGTADGVAENNLATAIGAAFAQGGTGTDAPTTWANQSKNNATWSNQNKS